MEMWMSRHEGPDHSIPEGRRAQLREAWATWLGRGRGRERNPAPIQYSTLCQVLSQAISSTKHLLCVRSHAGLFTCTVSNVKALLYTKSWLGAYLHICSFIKHLLHASPFFTLSFLFTEHLLHAEPGARHFYTNCLTYSTHIIPFLGIEK